MFMRPDTVPAPTVRFLKAGAGTLPAGSPRRDQYAPGVDLAERGDTDRRHPWEVERARFFRSLIGRHLGDRRPRRILDVGAGDAWFAGELGGI